MVLAIVVLVLGVLVGLVGLLFAGAKWLLVVAVVLLTAGVWVRRGAVGSSAWLAGSAQCWGVAGTVR